MARGEEVRWGGAFSPTFTKHRDYEHSTFFEHEMANGGRYRILRDAVMVAINPLTEEEFDEDKQYHQVELTTHYGTTYTYLVRSGKDGHKPTKDDVKNAIDEYAKNPVEGGRNILDYIVEENDGEANSSDGKFSIDDLA